MAKAILEIDIPESCMECPLAYGVGTINFCSVTESLIEGCWNNRRSDCPLKLVEGRDEQTNVKCRYCNSESVEIIARGTESILYKCRVCKMEFAKLNIKEGEP